MHTGTENGNGAPVHTPDHAALAHLELILSGSYPLPGFMGEAEARAAAGGALPDGTPWPIPVTLPVPADLAGAERVVLADPEGAPLAELRVSGAWEAGPDAPDGLGPGHRLAGEVRLAGPPAYGALRHLRLAPAELRARREAQGATGPLLAVVARGPLHHRALARIRDAADRIGGEAPAEVLLLVDVPLESQGWAPAVLAAEPLLPPRTWTAALTLPPGSDGDRVAPFVARAFGATHLLGDGGAGEDASPLPVVDPGRWRYDTAKGAWRPADEVEDGDAADEPSAEEVEEMLARGRTLPAWFTPARVAAELARLRPARTRRGLTVLFTGLSGSGKSTVARAVAEGIRRSGRTLTLLDGDVVRRMLSKGLTFSREDRDMNVRRIGYVAAEITRHGGVAVCAPIAPYAATRAEVRAMVEENGDFFLVHVATPLEECERRDRKGLYAKARAGEIPAFTGISDPYEEPADADLVLDTTGQDPADSAAEVLTALRAGGWLPGGPDGAEQA
ncbi:adenylyl-sulfate kinase [Nocardiopsis sp. RSe5-2]|uniref:Adenylyl-sulfate kinase n=1 Tax=Nocardiopsis endophytica TaxID=3018445 RepID=A0ABT4U2R2_9ACTN|nr:adenylyl-sulfate kinase [Nocardiopsis endophytica]MDA2811248.1 adenylyl-sulfate kinase [Nocardiopsis endophytica]